MAQNNILDLINSVKESNDEVALTTLINNVTGLYVTIVSGYTYVPTFERQELIESKNTNIYSYIKDFDPKRGMAFSTYVGQRVKWACKDLVNKYPEPEELENFSDKLIVENDIQNIDELKLVFDYASKVPDKRFFTIFKMRHVGKKQTWKKIGENIGLTNEGARRIYNKNIKVLKDRIQKENNKI